MRRPYPFQKGRGRVATIDIAFVKVYLSIALSGVHLRRTSSAGGLTLSFQVIEVPPRHRPLGEMSRRSHDTTTTDLVFRPLSGRKRAREARSREKFQMQFYARTTRDPYVKRRSRLPSRSSRIILNAFNASTRVSPIAFRVSPLCSTRKFDSATIFLLLEIPFAVDALFSRFDEELDYTGKRIRMFLMEFRRFWKFSIRNWILDILIFIQAVEIVENKRFFMRFWKFFWKFYTKWFLDFLIFVKSIGMVRK